VWKSGGGTSAEFDVVFAEVGFDEIEHGGELGKDDCFDGEIIDVRLEDFEHSADFRGWSAVNLVSFVLLQIRLTVHASLASRLDTLSTMYAREVHLETQRTFGLNSQSTHHGNEVIIRRCSRRFIILRVRIINLSLE
jgi:hypothetical protein